MGFFSSSSRTRPRPRAISSVTSGTSAPSPQNTQRGLWIDVRDLRKNACGSIRRFDPKGQQNSAPGFNPGNNVRRKAAEGEDEFEDEHQNKVSVIRYHVPHLPPGLTDVPNSFAYLPSDPNKICHGGVAVAAHASGAVTVPRCRPSKRYKTDSSGN